MRWWQWVLPVVALLALVPFMPLEFGLTWERTEHQPEVLHAEVRLFSVRIPIRLMPKVKRPPVRSLHAWRWRLMRPGGLRATLQSARTMLRANQRQAPIARYLLSVLTVRRFELALEFGSEDAATTGLAVGGIWALFGTLTAILRETVKLAPGQPRFHLTPNFTQPVLQARFSCIVSLRVGHIIVAGAKLVQPGLKGVMAWRTSTQFRG